MNQLKTGLLGLAVASATAFTSAHAEELKPYIGLDATMINANYKTIGTVNQDDVLGNNFKGVNPYVGVQVNKHFGVELGYLHTGDQSKSFDSSVAGLAPGTNVTTKADIKGFHLDAVGTYPATEKLDLLGSLGVARLKANITASVAGGSISGSETDTALRAGVGGRYALSDNLGVRGMLRYMKADFNDTTDGLFQYNVGLNYRF